jgi:hypothetical protein
MFRPLQTQEKEIRKLLVACKERLKMERKKEKKRARAMFSLSDEKKESDCRHVHTSPRQDKETERSLSPIESDGGKAGQDFPPVEESSNPEPSPHPIKKRVSFADGRLPGDVDAPDLDDVSCPSFFKDHKEALLIIGGFVVGSLAIRAFFGRRR